MAGTILVNFSSFTMEHTVPSRLRHCSCVTYNELCRALRKDLPGRYVEGAPALLYAGTGAGDPPPNDSFPENDVGMVILDAQSLHGWDRR